MSTNAHPIGECSCSRCMSLRNAQLVKNMQINEDSGFDIPLTGIENVYAHLPDGNMPFSPHTVEEQVELSKAMHPKLDQALKDQAVSEDRVLTDFQYIETKLNKHDAVNRPSHYTWHPSGVQQIEISEHMSYNLGCAIKYIWRCNHKGKVIEDLNKARFCIEREIERLQLDQADEWIGESK